MNKAQIIKNDKSCFLPDFCDGYILFLVVIVTELFAFILALAPLTRISYGWNYIQAEFLGHLAMLSLFMQWVTLVSIWLLCLIRRQLCKLENNFITGLITYLIILIVIYSISEFAWGIREYISSTTIKWSFHHHIFLLRNFIITALISALILGYFYYSGWISKQVAILNYIIILLMTLVISEILSFLNMDISLYHQAIKHQWFILRNIIISAIISMIMLRYFYIQYSWKQETEACANAQAQALQARIRPHFLFNTMNTIASLIRIQPDKAEQALLDFADLFRVSLENREIGVTFNEEVILCQQYLHIESLRLGERLQVAWNIKAVPADALLPSLSLQPLIENAVYYGIQPLAKGGIINIRGQFDGKQIRLIIENPLINIEPKHQGQHIAQDNIRQRLSVFFNEAASFNIKEVGTIYQINLAFPYKT
ncbi:MAG: histidine kinase [Thiomargarita sp.]|nr:histidine kinase [Thiomargarita sp.]